MAAALVPSGPIVIRASRIEQLYESLDPSPFHERDLDRDAARYVTGWAGDLAEGAPIHLRIHLPASEAARPEATLIPEAVHRHFDYLAKQKEWELRDLLRLGRTYFLIGVVTLLACLTGAQLIRTHLGDAPLPNLAREGLIILGWVSNWKPLETFLYDWWPIRRQMRLMRRLAEARVEIVG